MCFIHSPPRPRLDKLGRMLELWTSPLRVVVSKRRHTPRGLGQLGVAGDLIGRDVQRPCRLAEIGDEIAGQVRGGGGSTSRVFPDACIRGVGTRFPALSVEFFYLEVREVDAFEAAKVDHVLRGVGSWSVERRHAAVAAEEMTRDAGSELIGRKIFATEKHTKSFRSNEMMQVSLLTADRAVALARTRKIGGDLESDSAAVTAAIVGLDRHQLLSGREYFD